MPRLSPWAVVGLLLLGLPAVGWTLYENGDLKYYDPRSSEGKSGHDTPREYFLPNTPTIEQYDPQEFDDYGNSNYSPYATVQIPRAIQAGDTRISEGYYLVKIVISNPPVQDNPSQPVPKPETYTKRRTYPTVTPLAPGSPEESTYRTKVALMLKQQGNTLLTIPVQRSESATQPVKNGAIAQLVSEPDNPISPEVIYLKYCVRSICYRSEPLSPNLVK